jgi:hypothetical protein
MTSAFFLLGKQNFNQAPNMIGAHIGGANTHSISEAQCLQIAEGCTRPRRCKVG